MLIILLVRFSLRGGVKIIPSVGQARIESVIGGLHGIIEPIIGNKAFRMVFPYLLGIFFFILLQNVYGLLPGIGSVGINVDGEFIPFFRPTNSDLNTTLALALVSFVAWGYFGIPCASVKGICFEISGNKAEKSRQRTTDVKFLATLIIYRDSWRGDRDSDSISNSLEMNSR
jgi:F-type H+-transporting ATPase subunit a